MGLGARPEPPHLACGPERNQRLSWHGAHERRQPRRHASRAVRCGAVRLGSTWPSLHETPCRWTRWSERCWTGASQRLSQSRVAVRLRPSPVDRRREAAQAGPEGPGRHLNHLQRASLIEVTPKLKKYFFSGPGCEGLLTALQVLQVLRRFERASIRPAQAGPTPHPHPHPAQLRTGTTNIKQITCEC